MNHHIRMILGLAIILVLLIAGTPWPVRADGIAITIEESDVEMPSQQAIIVWDEKKGHEDLILSVELLGSPEAAWVVPVPSLPEVKVASPKWFEYLNDLTKPKVEYTVEYVNVMEVEVEKEVGKSVELISREEVGVYDVSILSADEPGALLDWLNENGYTFSEKGGPILDAYVEEGGWYFVAARVLPGESAQLEGDVHPLWFSFDTERPIYPMRFTVLMKGYVQVLIYVLADHRMEIPGFGFRTEFAGEFTLRPLSSPELTDSDQEELVDLLTDRPYYISKLRYGAFPPVSLREDLYFEQADSDEPYREVIYHTRYVYRPATATPPTQGLTLHTEFLGRSGLLVLVAGLALLGLLAGLGLVWRRRSL